jgi:hypothetical protein
MNYNDKNTLLQSLMTRHGVCHFTSREFGRIGRAGGKYQGPNRDLPDDVRVMIPVIMLADRLRAAYGEPITVVSSYRPEEYNRVLSGTSTQSRHVVGTALDLAAKDRQGFLDVCTEYWHDGVFRKWAEEIEELLGLPAKLNVGFGVYPEPQNMFCHVDCGYASEPGGRPKDTRFK